MAIIFALVAGEVKALGVYSNRNLEYHLSKVGLLNPQPQ